MVNKNVVIICTIISIILITGYIFLKLNSSLTITNNTTYIKVLKTNQETGNIISSESSTQNEVKEEDVVNQIDENLTKEDEQDKNEINQVNGEDKAKKLAQNEWGKDDTVYYYIEEKKSDSVYIVSVRNKETTANLMIYKIDIENENVEEF